MDKSYNNMTEKLLSALKLSVHTSEKKAIDRINELLATEKIFNYQEKEREERGQKNLREAVDDKGASSNGRMNKMDTKVEVNILAILPPHKASLSITHNDHKTCYETVDTYLDNHHDLAFDWVTPDDEQKAREANELWELQWYPNSPVGFHFVYSATLAGILTYMEKRAAQDWA